MTLTSNATTPENHAPYGLSLSNGMVKENSVVDTVVGALSATDPDGDALTYELLDNAGGRFKLSGNSLVVADGSKLDYETAQEHDVKIRVSDANGASVEGTFTVKILDVNETGKNEAPRSVMMEGPNAVTENAAAGTYVTRFTSFDPENDPVSLKLIDSANGAFKLVGDKLFVADGSKIDHEAEDTWINLTVRATDDHGGTRDFTFSLYVRDVAREVVYGSKANNTISGGRYNDKLFGGAGNDKLVGAGGNDQLDGGTGNDVLSGGLGKDILTGGKGKDAFVFDTKLSSSNVDRIVDFSVKEDTIHLAQSIFQQVTHKGSLDADAFWIGSAAHDANDRIIYDPNNGKLYYDADGNGAGAAVQIALLKKGLAMTEKNFLII